jgi:acetylornithine deacetylase/succinyl-diaminopimelate desuccinylase-like protein
MDSSMREILRQIRSRTRTPQFKRQLQELLISLCRIDTTTGPDITRMRTAEEACFRLLEAELQKLRFPGTIERRPISTAIQTNPHYSLLHFTKTSERPNGLTSEETYLGRSNLVYVLKGLGGQPGQSIALNAHVDVVAPYFPPRARRGIVFGRGACDDKGPVVAIVGALKVLSELMGKAEVSWNRNVLAMFVVEEETGGNGSLSLALDRELKVLYDSVMVCECTGLKIHPANRGAVWYRAELRPPEGVSALEMAAFIIEQMEKEGAAIRAESQHELFPQRPVQTCHGIIDRFGEHPSRICGQVIFQIEPGRKPERKLESLLHDCLEAGLANYVGLYGDKTKVKDVRTGRPMVARHYDLRQTAHGFEVKVHGAAGHMGTIRERDGAITKMAHLIRSLVYSKARIESIAQAPVRIHLGAASLTPLILEGGQGFVPTHNIEEVMARQRGAAYRGAGDYLRRIGRTEKAEEFVSVTYEKLHNVAFDGNPASLSMRNALEAARICGLWKGEPVLGWTVSCDARLFASEHPGLEVLTFGPGQLGFAHSDQEQISVDEIMAAVEFLALFLLRQTGTRV